MSHVALEAGTNVSMKPHVFIFRVEVMETVCSSETPAELHGVTHKTAIINHLSFLHEQN
jgi:hypothetical protein